MTSSIFVLTTNQKPTLPHCFQATRSIVKIVGLVKYLQESYLFKLHGKFSNFLDILDVKLKLLVEI